MRNITSKQVEALRAFAKGGSSLEDLVEGLDGLLTVVESQPGKRSLDVGMMPSDVVRVDASSLDWMMEKYLRGKVSGEVLSSWAGILLAMNAFDLPEDDVVLGLLHDLAMPKKTEDLDRLQIALRLEELRKHTDSPIQTDGKR